MKTYHITTKDEYLAHCGLARESHFLDLPNGNVLVVAEFRDGYHEDLFNARAHVTPLPHLLSSETAGNYQAASSLLGGLVTINPSDRMYDISKKLRVIHPAF